MLLPQGATIRATGALVVGAFAQLALTNVTAAGTFVLATYESLQGAFSGVTAADASGCPVAVSNVVQGSQSLSVTLALQDCSTTTTGGLSPGAIAGIVVGSVVAAAVAVAAIVGAVLHKTKTASQVSFAQSKLDAA